MTASTPRPAETARSIPFSSSARSKPGSTAPRPARFSFVEPERGFGIVSLWAYLTQDDENSDIEIRAISWGSEGELQELQGAIHNAAEDFVRLDWSGVENAFNDNAATDWKRIMGKGHRRLLDVALAADPRIKGRVA